MSVICESCGCDVLNDGPFEHVVCWFSDDLAHNPAAPFYAGGEESGGITDEDWVDLFDLLVNFAEWYDQQDEQQRSAERTRAERSRDADVRLLLLATAKLIDALDNDHVAVRDAVWDELGDRFMELFERLFEAESDGGEIEDWRVDTQFVSWGGTVYWGTASSIRERIDKIAAGVRRVVKRLKVD